MFKLIWRLFQLSILALILALIFHNWTAKALLTFGLRAALGVSVDIQNVSIDFLKSQAEFREITIGNPKGFPAKPLAYIPLILLDLNHESLFQGRIDFHTVEVNLDQINVIRSADGRINLMSLRIMEKDMKQKGAPAKPAGPAPQVGWQINEFILSMGKATYLDLGLGQTDEREFNLRIQRSIYRNINGAGDAIRIVIWETLKRVGLSSFTQMLGQMNPDLKATMGEGSLLEKTVSVLKEKFQ